MGDEHSPSVLYGVLQVIAAVVGVLSFAASGYLLSWVCRLDRSISRKLMARQLWHVALSDVLTSTLVFPKYLLAMLKTFGGDFLPHSYPALNIVCKVSHLDNLAYMTSVFAEVHIALVTASAIFHWSKAVRVLSWVLPVVWLLGIGAGLLIVWLGNTLWDPQAGICNPHDKAEELKVTFMTVALVICLSTYVIGLFMGHRDSGGTVQGRQWRQAEIFVAAAVVTWLPFVVFTYYESALPGKSFLDTSDLVGFYVTSIFLSSNGLFNAVVYAWLSGFVRRTRRWNSTLRRLETDEESLATVPSANYQRSRSGSGSALQRPVSAPGSAPASAASFNVAFTVTDDDVVNVPGVTAVANRRAERAVARIEHHRESRANADRSEISGRLDSSGECDFLCCFDSEEQSPRGRSSDEITQDSPSPRSSESCPY